MTKRLLTTLIMSLFTTIQTGLFVLLSFEAIAQRIMRLPSAPGINFTRIQYLRAETSPDTKLERALLRKGYGENSLNYPITYSYNKVDLNGDGNPEVIVSVMSSALCGTGGCPQVIFQSDGRDYRLVVYESLGFGGIVVIPQKTSGWNDLIVNGYDRNAGVIRYAIWKFNGRKYTFVANVRRNTIIAGKAVLVSDDVHTLRR